MISLSTNVFSHYDGAKIVELAALLDFKAIELNFTLKPAQVNDILKSVSKYGIVISSLHNFVPEPPDGERSCLLSDIDDELREKAIKLTQDTIILASDVGASAVVLHLGQPRNWAYESAQNQLRQLIHADDNPEAIEKLRKEMITTRGDLPSAYFDSILFSLDKLVPFAQNLNIRLGLENRYYYGQFPSSAELGIIMQEFSGSNLGYWHDCGHAAHSAFCGFSNLTENLEAFKGRLLGVHLHDIKLWSDHQIPSPDGDTDFTYLKAYLNEDTIKVLELGRGNEPDLIGPGITYLNSKGIF
jgi:sugar phosphate isomerase/epimerase